MRKYLICLFLLISSTIQSYEYDLCACVIFRDEAPYLKEWIEFHKLVGVKKFYFINHLSKDNFKKVLRPYIENGEVELINSTHFNSNFFITQVTEYEEIRQKCLGKTKWLAILDSDEFIFPVNGKNLVEFLKEYEEDWISSLYVFWQCYGTSFVNKIPKNELMIATLVLKSHIDYVHNKYGKSIIRPERCSSAGMHFTEPELGFHSVLPNKSIITAAQMSTWNGVMQLTVDVSTVRINHYWTRDEDYLWNKKMPRYANWGAPNECMIRYPYLNVEYDGSILKYVRELKKAMK